MQQHTQMAHQVDSTAFELPCSGPPECLHACEGPLGAFLLGLLANMYVMNKHANTSIHVSKGAHMFKCVVLICAGGLCCVHEQETIGHQSVGL